MVKLNYLHEVKTKKIKDGEVHEINEEYIIEGPKGVMIKYYKKDSKGIEKIIINRKSDGDYIMKVTKDGDTAEKTLSKADLKKEISKNKKLAFADEFSKSKGLARSVNRSGSRKGSKKGTRKGTRKGSKKGSRKVVKKGSKKR